MSGANLTHRVTGNRSIVIEKQLATVESAGLDAGTTILDTITVTFGSGISPADLPYETPGFSVYLSSEQIERNKGASPRDMFGGIAGVINGENRNSGSVDINIRGIQG